MSHDHILDAARHFEKPSINIRTPTPFTLPWHNTFLDSMTLEERISHPYGAMKATGERAMESIKMPFHMELNPLNVTMCREISIDFKITF